MLRLRIAQREHWTDSTGIRHTPWERFNVLAPDAKIWLEQSDDHGLVAWDIAIVSDDPLIGDSAKLMSSVQRAPYHAVDVETARQLEGSARRLWQVVSGELGNLSRWAVLLVKDSFRIAGGPLLDVGEACAETWEHDHQVQLVPTNRVGVYSATASMDGVNAVLQTWWPSLAGHFSIVGAGLASGITEGVAILGMIIPRDLPAVDWVAESSTSFENVGFRLLTSRAAYEAIRMDWLMRGRPDGVALLSVLGLGDTGQNSSLA